MTPVTFTIVGYLQFAFDFALIFIELFALIVAARIPSVAYSAAFARTKGFWVALTAGGLALGVVTTFGPGLGMLTFIGSIAGLVMAGVFLADTAPELRRVLRNSQGPYRR